jgi:hypothetical protein
VYFGLEGSGLDYELYNIKNDPGQLTNLVHQSPTHEVRQEWARLHNLLPQPAQNRECAADETRA